MSDAPHTRPERQDPPEVAALRRLRTEAPDLAGAVDLQIELARIYRRVQGRLSTPWVAHEPAWIEARLRAGTPILRFEDVAFDWAALRAAFRQTAELLARHDLISADDQAALLALNRDSRPSPDDTRAWFENRAARSGAPHPLGEVFAQTLELSVKPWVERAGESARARTALAAWTQPYCPLCGSDPELASIALDGSRRLHCGGCDTAWPFAEETCPACLDRTPRQRLSYAGPDRRYRLTACGVCRRYIKTVDVRRLGRPLILVVDSIATLPLDAAAAQRGFTA